MEARLESMLPTGRDWQFEPKWDGFRCLLFKDGGEIDLISKSGKNLKRYFPDVVEIAYQLPVSKIILDGEIVVPSKDGFSFDLLLQRIHPAAARIKKLSEETPASFIAFDLLADESGQSLVEMPLSQRRNALVKFAHDHLKKNARLILSPASSNPSIIDEWRQSFFHKLDGVVAKDVTLPYQSGNRKGMVKVKWIRTADCVVSGFRYSSNNDKEIGSLLLGLTNEEGKIDHVGFCSSFDAKTRRELTARLVPLVKPPGFTGKAPSGISRWTKGEERPWYPLGKGSVAEVSYDHFSDGRFRHGTKLLRWRPDKAPSQCTFEQVQ
jgi:ATP-dependent DNA ligase